MGLGPSMAGLNFRVFRRNAKNLILLWSSGSLDDRCRETLSAFLVDEQGAEGPLSFTRFTPDNPEKFAKDVDGIVISHAANKMDAAKAYMVKVVFGEGDESMEMVKDVLPANSAPEPVHTSYTASTAVTEMRCYGYDYRTGKWVPMPIDVDMMGEA